MTNIELKEYWEELLSIYKGIIFNNCNFADGINGKIDYNFDCPQFFTLKEKYKLEKLAKQGNDFERAINLLAFFAPRINHKSDFQNDVNCNAMDLLEYCLDKPDNGINCLNKSKILQECCLALEIYARRVWLMPYSPYDTDNHVVVEIYDFDLGKWIMLDMSANGYFVNSDGVPLSVIEIRDKFATNEICKFVKTSAVSDNFFSDTQMECLYYKQYFAKNLCYLFVETQNEFSDNKKRLAFIPCNKRYTGVVEHQGELYDNIFPRIISDELWNKVNAINEENKLAPSRKKEIFDYILSGKLICGDCKHRMGGESGTSHTGAIHYYYICLSKRRKRAKCNMSRVQKQFIEDTVITATTQMLSSVNNIKKIAQSIYNAHKKETADNTALKLIEKKRAEAVKAQNNIVKAIEQGIITETTKSRLTELENLISQYDVEILKEKARSYTYLTADDIEMFLSKFVFDNTDDIKVRKLLVNAFIREVILYDDEIVITYNFTDSPEHLKLTKEHVTKTEKEIETADKNAVSSNTGSYKLCHTAPDNGSRSMKCT